MPFQLDTPVLTVDKEIIHKVDANNPQNLFSMWTGEYTLFTRPDGEDTDRRQSSRNVPTRSRTDGD